MAFFLQLGDAGTIDRFGLAFHYQIEKHTHKNMDKNNRKLKIPYKYIKANTGAIWQHMLHIPPTKIFISQLLKNKTEARATQKSLPFGNWRFRE